VIAGTATAVSNRVSDRHYNKQAEQQQAQMADQAALQNQQDMEQMQAQMQEAQEAIANETVEGTAGGGAVVVKATGAGKLLEVKIRKEAIDPEDPETLEDLVVAAVNAALESAEELAKSKLNLPDLGSLGLGF